MEAPSPVLGDVSAVKTASQPKEGEERAEERESIVKGSDYDDRRQTFALGSDTDDKKHQMINL